MAERGLSRDPHASVPLAAYATCAVTLVAVFARGIPYPLQLSWDDARFLTDDALVMRPSWDALVAIVTRPQLEAYHPLHLLSYWLDAPWSGADPRVLHTTSLLLWIVAACALSRALVRLGLGWPAALIATLACTAHPVQVEVVSWATGRKDVLALLFASLAIDAHLRADGPRTLTAHWSRLAYALGVLSKTTVLPLPLVLVAIDVLVRGKRLGRGLATQLPALAFGAAMSALVLVIWGDNQMIRPGGPDVGNALTRFTASVAHHLLTLVWPARLAPMYATTVLAQPSALDYGALLAFVALLVATLRHARRGSQRAALAATGLIAFVVLLLPVCNLVPMVFAFQDRYGSLPLLGLALAFGAALEARSRRFTLAAGALVALALAARTAQYQGAWQSERSLWGHAVQTQPDAYYAWMKVCELRRKSGELHGAVVACRKLVQLEPLRKTGHTALLLTAAVRDERLAKLSVPRAERYAATFHRAQGDARALRSLAAQMLASGHVRALELPLARSLALEPLRDDVLENAAAMHFAAGRASVGLFYLERMRMPTRRPELLAARASAERARAAVGAPRLVD